MRSPLRLHARAPWPTRSRVPNRRVSPAAALRPFFATAQVGPVLTAHPTEVRRKSTIDREMEVAEAAGQARSHRAHTRGGGAQRGGAAPCGADLVANQPLARHQARRPRRGGERHLVLRLHVFARAAALLCGARRLARCGRPDLDQHGVGLVSSHGKLDRRRPRRESLRHGRGATPGLAAAEQPRPQILFGRAASVGIRAVARWAACRRLGRTLGTGGALARPLAEPAQ